jgi:hypothetical protein
MKHIKLFEQFVDESTSKVDKKDFDKVVAAVKKANQPATVILVTKWNQIEIIVGMDAPDPVVDPILDEIDTLGDIRNRVSMVGDTSSYSRREYDAIERIKGGHKNYRNH